MSPDLRKRLLEHSENAHSFQLSERDRISSQIAFCFAGLGLITSACVFYLETVPTKQCLSAVAYWMFLALAIAFGVAALYCFFHVLGFFVPNKYQILPSPRKIVTEINDLNYHATTATQQLALQEALEERLIKLYSDAAAVNECENERRKQLLRNVVRLSIVSLILLFANAIPFFIIKLGATIPPQAVEIVKPIRIEHERTEPSR